MEFVIISGLSGAGKSLVSTIFEDMGFMCVDNMPVELMPAFAELCLAAQGKNPQYERVALVTDIRAGQRFEELVPSLELLRAMNCEHKILFIEARFDAIVMRYKETRRRHPLAQDGEPLKDTLERESKLLDPIKSRADFIIDTTSLSTTALRSHLESLFSETARRPMVITVMSFGYKYGLPQEADLAFDVRFLPNPYHIADLRSLSGLDEPVRAFVLKWQQTQDFMAKLWDMTEFLLPQYFDEGKTSLVIAIGCTGGRHRSVTVARSLYESLCDKGYYAVLTHRDVDKDIKKD